MNRYALQSTWPRIFPGLANLSYSEPVWNEFAGEAGAFVSGSTCGLYEAMAEPMPYGWRFWLVPVNDPANALCMEDKLCAS